MSTSLYQKYRPNNLDAIIGQPNIVTILKNAITLNEVSHAYLFIGPRGTGKTSTARILAKELEVSGVDLIEIDAASHRGIDKIREIKESVLFIPLQGKRKMYILDEVHMLTTEAFNALLKTLEEPPSYCYFILCTTEPYKIPVTIMSRCQRLLFQKASNDQLIEYLKRVIEAEKITVKNEESLMQIANLADGSYRDALVVLEGAMGLSGDGVLGPIDLLQGATELSLGYVSELYSLLVRGLIYEFLEKVKSVSSNDATIRVLLGMVSEHTQNMVLKLDSDSDLTKPHINSPIDILEALNNIEARRIYSANLLVPIIIEISKLKSSSKNDQSTTISNEPKEIIFEKVKINSEINLQTNYLNQLIDEIKKIKPTLETLLRAVKDYQIDENGVITLTFNYIFHKDKLENKENLTIVEEIASKIHDKKVKIRCQVNKREITSVNPNLWDNFSGSLPNEYSTGKNSNPIKSKSKEGKRNDTGPDLLKVAQEVFGGQLIE